MTYNQGEAKKWLRGHYMELISCDRLSLNFLLANRRVSRIHQLPLYSNIMDVWMNVL